MTQHSAWFHRSGPISRRGLFKTAGALGVSGAALATRGTSNLAAFQDDPDDALIVDPAGILFTGLDRLMEDSSGIQDAMYVIFNPLLLVDRGVENIEVAQQIGETFEACLNLQGLSWSPDDPSVPTAIVRFYLFTFGEESDAKAWKRTLDEAWDDTSTVYSEEQTEVSGFDLSSFDFPSQFQPDLTATQWNGSMILDGNKVWQLRIESVLPTDNLESMVQWATGAKKASRETTAYPLFGDFVVTADADELSVTPLIWNGNIVQRYGSTAEQTEMSAQYVEGASVAYTSFFAGIDPSGSSAYVTQSGMRFASAVDAEEYFEAFPTTIAISDETNSITRSFIEPLPYEIDGVGNASLSAYVLDAGNDAYGGADQLVQTEDRAGTLGLFWLSPIQGEPADYPSSDQFIAQAAAIDAYNKARESLDSGPARWIAIIP